MPESIESIVSQVPLKRTQLPAAARAELGLGDRIVARRIQIIPDDNEVFPVSVKVKVTVDATFKQMVVIADQDGVIKKLTGSGTKTVYSGRLRSKQRHLFISALHRKDDRWHVGNMRGLQTPPQMDESQVANFKSEDWRDVDWNDSKVHMEWELAKP